MASRLNLLLDLLHGCVHGALATHSLALPGFPFASSLPFVVDASHQPVFLISRLAEHTQNLLHDARCSLLLRGDGAVDAARATLVGEVEPIDADALLVARHLRYHPEAAQFIGFGDFRFFRLSPRRIRIIGGFAQAGWIEGKRLDGLPALPPAAEEEWIAGADLPAGVELLGVDAFGVDLRHAAEGAPARRRRVAFAHGPVTGDAVGPALTRALKQAGR